MPIMQRKNNETKKIAAIFLAAFLAVLFLVYSQYNFRKSLTNLFLSNQRHEVLLLNAVLENHLLESSHNLKHVGDMIRNAGQTSPDETINMFLGSHKRDFSSIFIVDAQGNAATSLGGLTENRPFIEHIKNKLAGEPETGGGSREGIFIRKERSLIALFVPLLDSGTGTVSHVVGTLNIKNYLRNHLQSLESEDATFVVAERGGGIYSILGKKHRQTAIDMEEGNLFNLRRDCLECHPKDSFQDFHAVLDSGQFLHTLFTAPDGRIMNRTIMPADILGELWILSISQPYETVQGQIENHFTISFGAVFVLAGCIFFGIYFAYKQRSRRLLWAQYRSLINNINVAIARVQENGKILEINTTMLSLLGVQQGEANNENMKSFFCTESALRELAADIGDNLQAEGQYWMKRKDEEHFLAKIFMRATKDDAGKILYLDCVVQDITEKERLEAQLRQASKMEAIGTMAGGIAHDFNNILSVIIGGSEMARDESPEGSLARHFVETVLKAAHRAKELTRQILMFSRQSPQELIPLKLHSIIKENLKLIRSTIPTTMEIREDIASGAGYINGDPTQIHQLVMNLCTNAAHAMGEKGVLEVRLREVSFAGEELDAESGKKPGQYLQLSVTDNGCGMDNKTLARIFEPFYTTKEVGRGTGMGLSVVHGIVKSHHGFIEVESAPGEGTSFHIYFPLINPGPQAEQGETAEIRQGTERVLLVDDEKFLAEVSGTMIERLGYKVTVKTDSRDALATFASDPDAFDLVITDQSMPGLPGSELAAELLHIRPGLPIILCTGFSNIISEEQAREIGVREFLLKPLDRELLATTMRRALDA